MLTVDIEKKNYKAAISSNEGIREERTKHKIQNARWLVNGGDTKMQITNRRY